MSELNFLPRCQSWEADTATMSKMRSHFFLNLRLSLALLWAHIWMSENILKLFFNIYFFVLVRTLIFKSYSCSTNITEWPILFFFHNCSSQLFPFSCFRLPLISKVKWKYTVRSSLMLKLMWILLYNFVLKYKDNRNIPMLKCYCLCCFSIFLWSQINSKNYSSVS